MQIQCAYDVFMVQNARYDALSSGIGFKNLNQFILVNQQKSLKKARAKEHFNHWFSKADSFLERFNLMFEQEKFADAAFDLHQVAESCYKAILLVYNNRFPREHFLEILIKEVQKIYPNIVKIFPGESDEDKRLFKLLEYAYIGGRYDPKFKINKKELKFLLSKVNRLLTLSKKICRQKIEEII